MEEEKIYLQKKDKSIFWLLFFAICSVIIWQIPSGNLILYPFTILGTWFHEMAHGFTAIALGGTFNKLEIYPNASGLAEHSGDLFLGNIGRALVAGGGPFGPTLAGAFFIISSKNPKTTKFALYLLGIVLIISAIIWVRPIFSLGFALIFIYGIFILIITIKGNRIFQKLTIQFLGVQACISVYLSIGYLFSSGGVINGQSFVSDTGILSEYLLLPYWIWGTIILIFSAFMIVKCIKYVYKGSSMS